MAARPTRKIWYGGEIVAVDVVSFTLPFVGFLAQNSNATAALLGVGLTGYLFGGPLVHAANGRPASVVAGSFGLRLGVPLVTALIGVAFGQAEDARCRAKADSSFCGLASPVLGALGMFFGVIGASIIDVSAFARKGEKGEAQPEVKNGLSPRWIPVIVVARDHERRYVPTIGVSVSM